MATDPSLNDIAREIFPHLPAAVGVTIAFVLTPPKSHVGTAGLLIGSFGCAKFLGPALFNALPWTTELGAELIMGGLGVAIFQTLALALRQLDGAGILSSFLKKGD
jgi:hypothetical protein